jgi:excisionase family DNA binding protein
MTTKAKSRTFEIVVSALPQVPLKPLAVDAKTAAELMGVSVDTVYLMLRRREIPYKLFGGKKVIPLEWLEQEVQNAMG